MYLKRDKYMEVLRLYTGNYSARFYLREIGKLSGLPLKTTQNAIGYLEKMGILKSVLEGKNKYFRLNPDNVMTRLQLLQAEVYKTTMFLERYQAFSTFLKEVRTNTPLIVFGSFSNFAAKKDSDLDILVIAGEGFLLPTHLIPNRVHEIRLSEKEFMRATKNKEAIMKEIEDRHVILNNHSFYVNAMWSLNEK